MAKLGVEGMLTGLALGAAWVATACGGTANNPREEAAAGMRATGGSAGANAGAASVCRGVGENALIVNFDEGAAIVERNYPIAAGAMPGGTYAYADPADTAAAFAVAVVPTGHTCQALGLTVTGSSWRGIGLWTTVAVDANAYAGIVFWAKRGAGATEPSELTVSLGMDAVTLVSPTTTGTCAGTTGCVRPQAKRALTDAWTEYALHWADFTPGSADGVAVPASGTAVNGLDLAFTITTMGTPTAAEVDLDDIAFLK
jgi:hypothetical protein